VFCEAGDITTVLKVVNGLTDTLVTEIVVAEFEVHVRRFIIVAIL
jgi:flavoprotein